MPFDLSGLRSARAAFTRPFLLAVFVLGGAWLVMAPALARQPAPQAGSAVTASPTAWTNLLGDNSFQVAAGDGVVPLGWHRTFGASNQGPIWDHGVGHSDSASLSILDFLPDKPACWPIPNSPNPCEMWYSDALSVDPGLSNRLHFWAFAPQPARVIVGLLITSATGTNVQTVEYQDSSSSTTWGEGELVLTPEVLRSYGVVSSVSVFVRGAASDDAFHQVWVDDIEFGPAAHA